MRLLTLATGLAATSSSTLSRRAADKVPPPILELHSMHVPT